MRNHWRFQVFKHTTLGIDPKIGWLGILGGPLLYLPVKNKVPADFSPTNRLKKKHQGWTSRRWWNVRLKALTWRLIWRRLHAPGYRTFLRGLLCSNHRPLPTGGGEGLGRGIVHRDAGFQSAAFCWAGNVPRQDVRWPASFWWVSLGQKKDTNSIQYVVREATDSLHNSATNAFLDILFFCLAVRLNQRGVWLNALSIPNIWVFEKWPPTVLTRSQGFGGCQVRESPLEQWSKHPIVSLH